MTTSDGPRDLADGLFARASDTTLVTLQLQREARWIVEYYPVEAVRSRRGGVLEVDLQVADERWLQRLLLRLAPHARVLSPAEYAAGVHSLRTGHPQPLRLTRRTMNTIPDLHVRTHMSPLLIGGLGTTELLLILAVVVLLFGATKLPDLARGSGRALRIFKAETKGLMDDDEDDRPRRPSSSSSRASRPSSQARQAELDAERERLERNDGA